MDRQIPEKPEATTEMFQNRNVGGQKRWRSEKANLIKTGTQISGRTGAAGKGNLNDWFRTQGSDRGSNKKQ